MIYVFSCALSCILLIAKIQKDRSWDLLSVIYMQCQAVVKNLSHLVLVFPPVLKNTSLHKCRRASKFAFAVALLNPMFVKKYAAKIFEVL